MYQQLYINFEEKNIWIGDWQFLRSKTHLNAFI